MTVADQEINGDTSDGYHTFNELYEHRMALFVALMQSHPDVSWWSHQHSDGSMYEGGWIVAGMELPTGDISYHLNSYYTPYMQGIKELPSGKGWDGHKPSDIVFRLNSWSKLRGRGKI